ncbi:hypothetical protein AVEN_159066-1 [Araneus ventricosus]|uniref:Uncharacterized protein n=1 Tax=Araneus ventricosus TaxID=182803 RepID=A0A4Y2B807_ARAVE|nr:hypothetical protein AVEN_159066-1 [Araneus ventricosus]
MLLLIPLNFEDDILKEFKPANFIYHLTLPILQPMISSLAECYNEELDCMEEAWLEIVMKGPSKDSILEVPLRRLCLLENSLPGLMRDVKEFHRGALVELDDRVIQELQPQQHSWGGSARNWF